MSDTPSKVETSSLLVLNAGSSSLKFAVFTARQPLARGITGSVQEVGVGRRATLTVHEAGDRFANEVEAADHRQALALVVRELNRRRALSQLAAVGHRIVQGGPRFVAPCLLTPDVLAELRRWAPIDPDHLPSEISIVDALSAELPSVPQVACFDTAFHATMPRPARLLPLPCRFEAEGVRRYGFHGLSYSFLIEALARIAGENVARGRVVLAHLGSGASLAAVREGRCADTTMSFTPTSGIPMSTRSGDIDPGALLYLARRHALTIDDLADLVNRRAGLLGLSDTTPDMRELVVRAATDPRAEDAVAVFCHQAKKAIGAFAAVLGGMETLVFAGGIGENSPVVRARVVSGLEHLGVRLHEARNEANAGLISTDDSQCAVRVIATDEEAVIARETLRVVSVAEGRSAR